MIGYLNNGRSKGPLRPVLKINLLRKGLTPRLRMRDRVSESWALVKTEHLGGKLSVNYMLCFTETQQQQIDLLKQLSQNTGERGTHVCAFFDFFQESANI